MADEMTLTNMPPIILDEHAIAKLLPKLDIKAELTALFRALGEGDAVQPAQTVTDFPTGAGDFITYMGAIKSAGVFGAKLSPQYRNRRKTNHNSLAHADVNADRSTTGLV